MQQGLISTGKQDREHPIRSLLYVAPVVQAVPLVRIDVRIARMITEQDTYAISQA